MSARVLLRPRRFARLVVSDAMNIARDPMLLLAIVMSAAPAAAFHLGREAMNASALAAFGVADFARYVAPVALLVPGALLGWVTGFLLLEDRDDGPLLAIDVTPLGKAGWLAYRAAVTAVVTVLISLFAARVIVPEAGSATVVVLALMVGAYAVLAALVLPALARNKVEGLALTKLTNLACLVPLLAIVPSPWRYLAGIVPSFWVGELLQLSGARGLPGPWSVVAAAASVLAVAGGLWRLFGRRIG